MSFDARVTGRPVLDPDAPPALRDLAAPAPDESTPEPAPRVVERPLAPGMGRAQVSQHSHSLREEI